MIREAIRNADRLFGLFKDVGHITVALSGGADSMALLHGLCALADEYGFTVSAAHYNHGIRGAEALRDEKSAEEYCKRLGVPFLSGRGDVPSAAKESGESLELAARRMRYEFLESIPEGVIATAHHAGDNFETVLFNLIRGTGLAGLCGIPPKRGRFIRPLLLCSREEIEEYCLQNGIPFVTDSTNLSDEYDRNRIRHRVIPELEAVRASAQSSVMRASLLLREDEECLTTLAKKEYAVRLKDNRLLLDGFDALPAAIAKRVIRLFCADMGFTELEAVHINRIYSACEKGERVSLPRDTEAAFQNGSLIIRSANEPHKTRFSVEIIQEKFEKDKNERKVHNLFLKNSFDCDKIVGKLVLRTRKEGDRVRIYRRGGTKTLKKLYNEYGIPLNEREQLPVLCDDAGIVWIARIGVAERCAVSEETKRVFKVSFKTFEEEVKYNE